MMKNYLLLARKFLVSILTLSATVLLVRAAQQGAFTYEDNGAGVTVTKYAGEDGAVAIPETIAGKPVTGFDLAFFRNTGLTSLTIPNAVTYIGQAALLGCTGLTNITIPNSVTSIGSEAFSGCAGFASVTIPKSVSEIGHYAFSECTGLTSVNIPDSVRKIGYAAFISCSALTSVTIGNRVTIIEDNTFVGCTSLSRVTIGASVSVIGWHAFNGCTGLTSIRLPGGLEAIAQFAFAGCTGLTSATIPGSASTIQDHAFAGCAGLTNLAIGSGVTSIGDNAFFGCSGLTRVTIPNSVTYIGAGAFLGCTSLTSITMDALNLHYSSVDGVLFGKDQSGLIQYPGGKMGSYAIPSSVTSIGDSAFQDCTGLTSVSIPESVTEIGRYSFAGCAGLTSLTIPNSVTSIDESVFQGCTGLSSILVDSPHPAYSSVQGVLFDKSQATLIRCPDGKMGGYTIPDSVINISWDAFFGCGGLTSVIMPKSLSAISWAAFSGCTGLKSVYFLGNQPGFFVNDPGSEDFSPAFFGTVGNDRATMFYRAGTTGWGETFGNRPTLLWVGTDDLDQDGMNNQEEMLAGTDPLDGTSLLAFEGALRPEALAEADQTAIPAGQHALYFQSIPGTRYEILSSETLAGPWTPVATVSANTSQKRVLLDKPALAAFYPIRILPPQGRER